MNKEFILHSDVEVFSIPDGEKILLKKGIPGIITQSLGNNFTIVVEGNMYQVKGSDAETIGEEKKSIVSNNFANKEEVWNILQTCYDPEIPVNIVDLGLVYDCTISEEKDGSGNTVLSGEIKNVGNKRADFAKIIFTFRINWQGDTKTLTAFISGITNTFDTGISSDNSILPHAVGTFEIVIPASFGSFIGYSYDIDWSQYDR